MGNIKQKNINWFNIYRINNVNCVIYTSRDLLRFTFSYDHRKVKYCAIIRVLLIS